MTDTTQPNLPTLFPQGEPPISGEVQFWRMDPAQWGEALAEVRDELRARLWAPAGLTELAQRAYELEELGARAVRGSSGGPLHEGLELRGATPAGHDHRGRPVVEGREVLATSTDNDEWARRVTRSGGV